MRPAVRYSLLALAAVLGLSAGWAVTAVPGWLAAQVRQGLVERAGRRGVHLTIGHVDLAPLSALTLEGVELREQERPDAGPFARIARLRVEYEWNGIAQPKVYLQRVQVVAPEVHAVRGADGRVNVEAVVRRLLERRGDDDDAGGSGGLRRFLSKRIPDVEVEGMRLAFDDTSGAAPAAVGGVDLRHLRLSEARLVLRNRSPVQEAARLELEASTRLQGIGQPVLAKGELDVDKRQGFLTVRLPGDVAFAVGRFNVAVGSATVHADGRVALEKVRVAEASSAGKFGLDVAQIVAHLEPLAGPEPELPAELKAKLPAPAVQLLRHIREVSVVEPVIVAQRQSRAAGQPGAAEAGDDEAELDPEAPPLAGAPAGQAKGKAGAKVKPPAKGPAAKEPAAKDAHDGRIVRENLAGLFGKGADRLQGELGRLRGALAAIPIPVVSVQHGRARFSDEGQDGPARELSDFNVRLERKPGESVVRLQVDFNVSGRKGAANGVTGRVDTGTGDAELKIQLEHLPLLPYAALLPSSLAVEAPSAIEKAAVSLHFTAATGQMTLEGRGTVAHVHADVPRLSRHRIQDVTVQANGRLDLDLQKQELQVRDAEIVLGRIHALLSSSVKQFRTAPAFDLGLRIPTVGCQDAVDSVPKGFATLLEGMRCTGQMSFEVKAFLDTAKMTSLQFDFDAALGDVVIQDMGKYIRFDIFDAPFEHNARQKDGSLYTFVTGPDTERWVPLAAISPHVVKVLTTTEDGGFFGHKGFSLDSIRSAMVENLKRGRFVRGASTITQQLVKNLFFVEREKTIARKVQEAVTTWQIERQMAKPQMLELYLNIIEFGPKIYGIRAAAQHYFNRPASELTLLQAIWLGSIIPNPRAFYHQFQKGAVSDNWRTYLCWIGATMLTREKITEDEFRRLGGCVVVFGGGPDGSEPPLDPGLGHEGDPTLQPDEEGTLAPGEMPAPEQPAPSVAPDEQP